MKSMKNAIVLCSGGIDSSVTAYYAKKKLKYRRLLMLFFNYGQRTLKEERSVCKKIVKRLGAEFRELRISELGKISPSLINKKKKAKKISRKQLKNTEKESENWYVPCRNIIFLIYALAIAESLQIKEKKIYDILTGFKCEGKEAYPDTTPEFVREMNKLKKISTSVKGKIIAPLIKKDKEEIVLLGKRLGVKLEGTYSCYVGGKSKRKNKKEHCGCCLACRLRQEAFYWANVPDPTLYKEKMRDFREAGN